MKKPSLASVLLRTTCPVVVFGYLCWLAIDASSWKLLLCLLALVGTLGFGILMVRRVGKACETSGMGEDRRRANVAAALLMTKRLGGVFCGMAVAVGVSYSLDTARFMAIALPVLLSGWGAMLWIARRALCSIR